MTENNKMIKICEMNSHTESKLKCLQVGFIINIILGYVIYLIHPFDIAIYLNEEEALKVFVLPIVLIITLFIHEIIHIIGFKAFGKGQAKIRVRRDKKAGAIVIQQVNENVFYSKKETMIILLAPLVLITLISIPLLFIPKITFIVYLNCILNSIGSSIDMYVSLKLLRSFNNDIKIQYSNGDIVNMIIYKNNIVD